MSAPLYGTRPPLAEPGDYGQSAGSGIPSPGATGLGVSTRVIRLDPGLFSLALMPNPADRGTGLPAVRVSPPPGPPGRREAVTISTLRGDGWMTVHDEPTLLRVPPPGAEILVTLYWSTADGGASPPALKLVRLNPDAPIQGAPLAGPPAPGVPHGPYPPARAAEIVAHIEGVGDVDGKIGDWVGMRGSGRAIEGFSLAPSQGLAAKDTVGPDAAAVAGDDALADGHHFAEFAGKKSFAAGCPRHALENTRVPVRILFVE